MTKEEINEAIRESILIYPNSFRGLENAEAKAKKINWFYEMYGKYEFEDFKKGLYEYSRKDIQYMPTPDTLCFYIEEAKNKRLEKLGISNRFVVVQEVELAFTYLEMCEKYDLTHNPKYHEKMVELAHNYELLMSSDAEKVLKKTYPSFSDSDINGSIKLFRETYREMMKNAKVQKH